ncbi:hypothetical protein CYMTET_37045 [Cymbomonas tetramitiformis]|uniref:Uncharacterized protein n=1 Tax=Cymbomonas tetramitiformis TaxID=36881 RepID=A0AAE0CGY4_9CHLO|nr:hypothetical protein CYMTET_37045 [Cymbomonas tetramitiformis]
MSFMNVTGNNGVVEVNTDAYKFITEKMKAVLDEFDYYTSHLKFFNGKYDKWKQARNKSLGSAALTALSAKLIEEKDIKGKIDVIQLFSAPFRKAYSFFEDVEASELLDKFCLFESS